MRNTWSRWATVPLLCLGTVIFLVSCGTQQLDNATVPTAIATSASIQAESTIADEQNDPDSVGGWPGDEPGEVGTPLPSTLPTCAPVGSPVALPADFPTSFPLPLGSVVTSKSSSGGTVTIGVVSPTNIRGAVQFFKSELPKAGFQLGKGDAEANEAEANFVGKGYVGRFKVSSIEACPGAINLSVRVQR